MGVEVATFGEGLAAAGEGAGVGTFTRVRAKMYLECGRPAESSVAQNTCIGPFVRVRALVVLQVSSRSEYSCASWVLARVRLLPRVRPYVRFQISLLAEVLPAVVEGAFVRTLASLRIRKRTT